MRVVTALGATGSVGQPTIDLVLGRRLAFPAMAEAAERVMDRAARDDGMPRPLGAAPDLGEGLEADRLARPWAEGKGGLVEASSP